MIPIKLTLRNFLSYGEASEPLDFTDLHVACLTGSNGGGKSALLDGITWALWGQARAAVDDLVRLGQSSMQVEFDFAFDGAEYRVIRKRTRGRVGSVRPAVPGKGAGSRFPGAHRAGRAGDPGAHHPDAPDGLRDVHQLRLPPAGPGGRVRAQGRGGAEAHSRRDPGSLSLRGVGRGGEGEGPGCGGDARAAGGGNRARGGGAGPRAGISGGDRVVPRRAGSDPGRAGRCRRGAPPARGPEGGPGGEASAPRGPEPAPAPG